MKKEKFDFVRIVIEKKEANGNFEITNAFEVDIDTYEKDIEGSNLEKYIKTLSRRTTRNKKMARSKWSRQIHYRNSFEEF